MRHKLFIGLSLFCLLLCSCGGNDSSGNTSTPSEQTNNPSAPSSQVSSDTAPTAGTRGSTPVSYIGSADGLETYGNDSVTIDTSHKEEGYVMVSYTGNSEKVKFQLTGPDEVTYTYNLQDGYETFPLTAGNGSYTMGIFENIEGTSYSTLFTQSIEVNITDELKPFLYANQYVNFGPDSATAKTGEELAYSANSDLEVVENVYNYIISNFTYDYDKAKTVPKGYLPVVDEILNIKTGICFDYAAVMATMLRTQNIPTRLEVGYMLEEYHAWISIYLEDTGWINGIIEFDGTEWKLMDPTFASSSKKPQDFIMETDKYLTKYVY